MSVKIRVKGVGARISYELPTYREVLQDLEKGVWEARSAFARQVLGSARSMGGYTRPQGRMTA